jgi:NTE family protein
MNTPARKPVIGLALGGGAARGWSHIGVIRALEEAGIRPDVVCGTSMGALVGAAYAAGELDAFEEWALGLGLRDVLSTIDVSLSSGFFKGEKLMEFLRGKFLDRDIEDLALPFAAVATSLHSGAEIWLRHGSTLDAVRASIAVPGLFTPVISGGDILVDGGLVNPIPVSLARAMGADVLIAVDLCSDLLGRRPEVAVQAPPEPETEPQAGEFREWINKLQDYLGDLIPDRADDAVRTPSMLDVLTASVYIMQVRIARSRLAGEPPDLVITPRLGHLGLLDFQRAAEAIEEGRRAVERIAHALPGLT